MRRKGHRKREAVATAKKLNWRSDILRGGVVRARRVCGAMAQEEKLVMRGYRFARRWTQVPLRKSIVGFNQFVG